MFLSCTRFARVRIPTYALSVTYVSTTYAIPRRTYSSAVDVRIHARTSLREIQIRDYAVEMESGLRGTTQSRIQDSGLTLDLMKKIPLAHSGLRLAPKFTIDTSFIYGCDVANKITA